MSNSDSTSPPDPHRSGQWEQVQQAIHGLRYGSVNIIIQDGVVIQIDRTEKRRLRKAQDSSTARPDR